MDPKRDDFSEQTIFFDTPTEDTPVKVRSPKQKNTSPRKKQNVKNSPATFAPGADGSHTIVPQPERKTATPWSVTWKISTYLWKLALGVALVIAIAMLGLVGYLTVTEYNPAYAENAKRGSVNRSESITNRSLKLVTFNTGHAGSGKDEDSAEHGGTGTRPDEQTVKSYMDGIQTFLDGRSVDFLFLQEVDVESDRSFGVNQWLTYEASMEDYESRFAMNFSCDYLPYPLSEPVGKVNSGLATYSAYDITSATRYSLSSSYTWPSRMANPKPCLLVSRIPIDGSEQELVLINLQLEATDNTEDEDEQYQQLLSLMKAEYAKGNYVIAGGDFNRYFPWSRAYAVEDETVWTPESLPYPPTGWTFAYDDKKPTCRLMDQPFEISNVEHQFYVIDGFFLSPNITVDDVITLDYQFRYSDHNPVLLEFTLETSAATE